METDRHGKAYRAIIKRMGPDGKLGVGWPKEFGGLGFGPIEQQIFVNEAARADVPLPAVTLQTVGPTLQAYGTESRRRCSCRGILAGDVHFAIGYTEPEAGTDLASLRTTAVRDGDDYVVNGQKIWTTGGHDADYLWLAVPHRPGRRRSTRASRSSSSTPPIPATPGRRSSLPTARTTPTRPTTTTSGCRSTCWSARRTRAGG